jgi:hypothetical protein
MARAATGHYPRTIASCNNDYRNAGEQSMRSDFESFFFDSLVLLNKTYRH